MLFFGVEEKIGGFAVAEALLEFWDGFCESLLLNFGVEILGAGVPPITGFMSAREAFMGGEMMLIELDNFQGYFIPKIGKS